MVSSTFFSQGFPASLTLCAVALSVSACASLSPEDIESTPSNVGVKEALTQIGEGFSGMKKALGETKLGLHPCKVTVNLNVTAGATDNNQLVIDLSATPPTQVIDASASVKGDFSATSTAQRGNTVVVEMYNLVCLPEGTLGYEKPDKYPIILEAVPDRTGVLLQNPDP
jgi:hypothetical protein